MKCLLVILLMSASLIDAASISKEASSPRNRRQTSPSQQYYTPGPVQQRAGSGGGGPGQQRPQPFVPNNNALQTVAIPRFVASLNAAGPSSPQGFRSSSPVVESEEIDRNSVSPTPQYLRPQQSQSPQQYRGAQQQQHYTQPQVQQQYHPQQYQQQQQQQLRSRPNNNQQELRRPNNNNLKNQQLTEEELAELEEEDKEEPDRLATLLPNSKFSCASKNTGYYADEGLNCEVFHYCQDNARHSWICPEGFSFHQVHLICMPPSGDNICKQSSQFHFVNDYLYRPINEEELLRKPNATLKYSDRYYPENFYEENDENYVPLPARRPAHVQQQLAGRTPIPQQQFRQASTTNQVFHSPEEVNIPLQHRRPQQQQQQRISSADSEEEEY